MRCPFATWRGSPNVGGTPTRPAKGLVVHVEVGTESGTISCFENPTFKASAHFGCDTNGSLDQFVDTDDEAWAEVAGNPGWISVETAGYPNAPLTSSQVASLGRLFAWLQTLYHFPSQTCDHDGTGLTTHAHYPSGAPDDSWGGHPCLPLDTTELLTERGWKPLAAVTMTDPVASWSPDSGLIRFEAPLGIVPPYQADTVVAGPIEATPDHRVYVRYRQEPYKAVPVEDVKVNARLPESGYLALESGLELSDAHLRLLVWVQADGHYMVGRSGLEGLEFHFRKDRKIARVTALLDELGIQASIRGRSDGSTVIRVYGVDWLRREILRWLPAKHWTWEFLGLDGHQWDIFLEELMQADGYALGQVYRSSESVNLDVVQALAHLHGMRATFDGHGLKLSRGRNGEPSIRCLYGQSDAERTAGLSPRPVRDGRENVLVSCLTTVDDTLLIRQSGVVSIVGNCPGPLRSAQLPAILAAAHGTPTPAPKPAPPPPPPPPPTTIKLSEGTQVNRTLVWITTDGNGDGWTIENNIAVGKVVSVEAMGGYPPTDGYNTTVARYQDRGGHPCISVTNGPHNTNVGVFVVTAV